MSAFILDMDGTIYRGQEATPYAKEFISYLDETNQKYLFFTNAPENAPEQLCKRLQRLGIQISKDHIITAGMLAIDYLKQQCNVHRKRVYILGSEYVKSLAAEAGLSVVQDKADYVLAAYDEHISMGDVRQACIQIANGAKFIATNPDDTIPEGPLMVPHTGVVLYGIKQATGKTPIIIGKPSGQTAEYFMNWFGCPASEIYVIGDRLDTDMGFAESCGFQRYLMLTGVTTHSQAGKNPQAYDKCFRHLGEVKQLIEGCEIG